MSTRIGLLGGYGTGNLGDEAVLEGLLQVVQQAVPGVRTLIYATDPSAVARHVGSEVRRLRVLNFAAMLRAVGEIDALLIGGGGMFHDYSRVALSRYVLWALAARLRRRPVMLAAVGVGPVHTGLGAAEIRATAALANRITVRDGQSLRWLRRIGVKKEVGVLADPALLVRRRRPKGCELSTGSVVFVLRPWPPLGGDEDRLAGSLASAADAVARQLDTEIVLMPFHSPSDDEFCAAVGSRMQHSSRARVSVRPTCPCAAIEEFGRARLVVSMRLHGLILAAAAGVPLVALACDEKLASFMAEIGQDELSLPLEPLRPENVAAACSGAVSAAATSLPEVELALREMRRRAARLSSVVGNFLAPVADRGGHGGTA